MGLPTMYWCIFLLAVLPPLTEQMVRIVVGSTCTNFMVYDDYDYQILYAFTATKANYDRTFTGSTCKTVYLPYATTLPTGLYAYELTAQTTQNNTDYFRFTVLSSGSTLTAYQPYLLRIDDSYTSSELSLPEMSNVSVAVTPDAPQGVAATSDSNWKFYGTTVKFSNSDAASLGAYNLSSNVWKPIKTTTTSGYVNHFRCFIAPVSASATAKSFSILLPDASGTITGFSGVSTETTERTTTTRIYNMAGQYVGDDLSTLEPGVYIANGKKIIK